MAKGNAQDPQDTSVNDQGFKKTVTSPEPSGNKEPIANPADKYIHEAPVHDANVADAHVDEKNGSKHDMENKFGVSTK